MPRPSLAKLNITMPLPCVSSLWRSRLCGLGANLGYAISELLISPRCRRLSSIIPPSYARANQPTSMRLPYQPLRYVSGHSQSSAYQSRLAPSPADLCRALLFRSSALHCTSKPAHIRAHRRTAITSRFAAVGRSALLRLCAATARPGPAPLLHACAYHSRATHCPRHSYLCHASVTQHFALPSQVSASLRPRRSTRYNAVAKLFPAVQCRCNAN